MKIIYLLITLINSLRSHMPHSSRRDHENKEVVSLFKLERSRIKAPTVERVRPSKPPKKANESLLSAHSAKKV